MKRILHYDKLFLTQELKVGLTFDNKVIYQIEEKNYMLSYERLKKNYTKFNAPLLTKTNK